MLKKARFRNRCCIFGSRHTPAASGNEMITEPCRASGKIMKNTGPHMPLSMAGPGEKLIITNIMTGRNARCRLVSMVLCPGDSIEVISNDSSGRMVIRYNNTRIAMGKGLAEKILTAVNQ